jgi:lysophospholipase L1-like esterase
MRQEVFAKLATLAFVLAIWIGLNWGGWIPTAMLAFVLSLASVSFNIAALVLAFIPVVFSGPIAAHVTENVGPLYIGALALVSAVAFARRRLVFAPQGILLGCPALARRIGLFARILGFGALCSAYLALDREYPLASCLSWLVLLGLCWLALWRHFPPKQRKQPMPGRWRAKAATFGMFCVSLAPSLLIIEVGAHVLLPPAPMGGDYLEYDPQYLFFPSPGGIAHNNVDLGGGKVKPVELRFSSQGFRDTEVLEKEPGEFRICMLGDSFTVGHATAVEDGIPRQLEARLRTLLPDRKIRVVNCGCEGAGCLQEIGMLRKRVLPLKPDLVILQLFPGNDIENALEVPNKIIRAYDKRWVQTVDEYRNYTLLRYRLDRWAFRHLRAYQILCQATSERWITLIANRCRLMPNADLPRHPAPEHRPFWIESNLKNWYPELEEGFRIMIAYTKQMNEESRAAGVGFMAYCIPDVNDLSSESWEQSLKAANPPAEYEQGKGVRRTTEALKQSGIPYAPVSESLFATKNGGDLYYPLDGHLTEAGNRLVADTLAAEVKAQLIYSAAGNSQ